MPLYRNCMYYDIAQEKDALNGDTIAICNIGTDLARCGLFSNAIMFWEYIIEKGLKPNVEAYTNLGVCYFYGNGVEIDQKKAVHYYQKAAALGFPYAYYNFAVALEQGLGTVKDLEKALYYYRKAADNHVNEAIDALIRLGKYDELFLQYYTREINNL